jgi:hypothetical protein
MRILPLALLATGCVVPSAVPAAFHPTASDTDRSVAVSVGGSYLKDNNTKFLNLPYGEASINLPVSPGQLSVHLAPDVLYLGYRYDFSKLESGVAFGVEPVVGGSYASTTSTDSMGVESTETVSAVMVGIAPIISIPTGSGFAYFIPKLGYQYLKVHDPSDTTQPDNTSKIWVLGLSVGAQISNGVSFELAIHRLDNTDDMGTNTSAAWLVVPTIGFRH